MAAASRTGMFTCVSTFYVTLLQTEQTALSAAVKELLVLEGWRYSVELILWFLALH
jgi:hypothetical protein